MSPLAACPTCNAAVHELDVDANVALPAHLDAEPVCAKRFDEFVASWDGSWSIYCSGAA